MNLNDEIKNLQHLRSWLVTHQGRIEKLNMSKDLNIEKSVSGLDITTKRLRIEQRKAEAKQQNLF